MAFCRSCGAEIKFIKLTTGKWNPVDVGRRTIKRGEGNDVIVTDNGEVVRGDINLILTRQKARNKK